MQNFVKPMRQYSVLWQIAVRTRTQSLEKVENVDHIQIIRLRVGEATKLEKMSQLIMKSVAIIKRSKFKVFVLFIIECIPVSENVNNL